MNPSTPEISTRPSTRLAGGAMETRAMAENGRMRVAHVLRKYNPEEWGGTETAIHRLFTGLRQHGVESVVYGPRLKNKPAADPLEEAGCAIKRFGAFLPVLGLSKTERRQHIA